MRPTNSQLAPYRTTIFTTMSALALEYGAVNLGQGFPDEEGPQALRQRARPKRCCTSPTSTRRCAGCRICAPRSPNTTGASTASRSIRQTEALVTSGATEALAACFFGVLEPGDEAVLMEPLYDSYLPIIERAGAIPRLVRLTPPDWHLPREALAAAFSPRTKLLVLNSPLNPAGKVFDDEELSFIAGLLERHDAYAVCDEVYEHLVFDGRPHRPLMTLPGMRQRCLRIGSAGKTFSATGWKVGYVTGAPPLIDAVGPRPPVPHLHHAAQPAEGRRPRAAAGRWLLCRSRRRSGAASATG